MAELSDIQKLLAVTLHNYPVSKEGAMSIIIVVGNDDEMIKDMVWFMGTNPGLTEDQLIAVAYQLQKDKADANK